MKAKILFVAAASMIVPSISGSAQNQTDQTEQRLLLLIQQVQAQQAQITANQTKIDAKMAEITEAVRVARIFAGRGGK
jgi:predicted PurR-regulated permease PerM